MLKPWIQAQPRLVEVAAGRAPADLVIRGGQWVNVHTREVIPGIDVAVADGRVASEPTIDVALVAQAVLDMARLPLSANVQFMTLMATKMPLVGRG